VGWGYKVGNYETQEEESDLKKGGETASFVQQVVDLPIVPTNQVSFTSLQ
jgi:hypothetical protein